MQSSAVVFNGLNSLDFYDIRVNAIRIPEVSVRLRQAQHVLDRLGIQTSLVQFISSENDVFLVNIRLKGLCAAIVQVGLYDRLLKVVGSPDFVIGPSNGDAAAKVISGAMSLEQMVGDSIQATLRVRNDQVVPIGVAPLLCGIEMTEFSVFYAAQEENSDLKYAQSEIRGEKLESVVKEALEVHSISRLINIGPGQSIRNKLFSELALTDTEIIESVDMDPMLSWFWPSLREQMFAVAIAQ